MRKNNLLKLFLVEKDMQACRFEQLEFLTIYRSVDGRTAGPPESTYLSEVVRLHDMLSPRKEMLLPQLTVNWNGSVTIELTIPARVYRETKPLLDAFYFTCEPVGQRETTYCIVAAPCVERILPILRETHPYMRAMDLAIMPCSELHPFFSERIPLDEVKEGQEVYERERNGHGPTGYKISLTLPADQLPSAKLERFLTAMLGRLASN